MSKRIQGWNPTYFGEPKKGSLASVITDITNNQNSVVGDKPVVQDSVAVQAQKEKEQLAKEGKMMKATHKPGHKDDENSGKDMRKKNKDSAKGEETPVKVHGEDLNAEIEAAKQGKVKSLVDTIKSMYYNETNKNDKSDDGEGMDAVQPKAVKKKFKDRKDKDIDNDGDVDDSDKFLHKRRKAISKAVD